MFAENNTAVAEKSCIFATVCVRKPELQEGRGKNWRKYVFFKKIRENKKKYFGIIPSNPRIAHGIFGQTGRLMKLAR